MLKKQADKKKFDVFSRVDLDEELLAMKKIGDEYIVAQNLCRSLLRENEMLKQTVAWSNEPDQDCKVFSNRKEQDNLLFSSTILKQQIFVFQKSTFLYYSKDEEILGLKWQHEYISTMLRQNQNEIESLILLP